MNNLRTASGRQFRSAPLLEISRPFPYEAASMPGSRVLGDDGQVYESMRDPVTGLYGWKVRAQGERGPALELQKTTSEIQWRVAGSTGPWTTLALLADIMGPQGQQGPDGPPGPGLSFRGNVPTVADLPATSTRGYGYVVTATNEFWIWDGAQWVNTGPVIQGPPGPRGPDGQPGKPVELRKTATEIQWRLEGQATWTTLALISDFKGPAGDQGPDGPPGPGFSYQGTVATVASLPPTATQGHGYKVVADGNLYIWNGVAWVNAGPMQGPKGDTGDSGPAGPPGPGFSYQGSLPSVAALPTPSTQGYAYRVETDLWIYSGTSWVNAGTLQGPKGDTGGPGPDGPPGPGFSYRGEVASVAALPAGVQGWAYRITGTSSLYIFDGLAWVDAGPFQGPKGDTGDSGVVTASAPLTYNATTKALGIQAATPTAAGSMSAADKAKLDDITNTATSTPQFAGLGLGTAPVSGWDLVIADSLCQRRLIVTAVSNVYTLGVQAGNEFIAAASINAATTINLANLANIPSGYLWRGVFSFTYTSGTISWFTGNSGFTVKWDGGAPITLTSGNTERVVIDVVGGASTIELAPLRGRA